jgi:hypothetical protein
MFGSPIDEPDVTVMMLEPDTVPGLALNVTVTLLEIHFALTSISAVTGVPPLNGAPPGTISHPLNV